MRITMWTMVIGAGLACVAGCDPLEPADCEPDETYVNESFECGAADDLVPAGPACLPSCDPNVANPCEAGRICGAGNTCIVVCG